MRLEELLKSGTMALAGASETPQLDAELLLCQALGCSRPELHARLHSDAAPDEASRYRVFVERRKAHEPVAYIRGFKEFWSLEFIVNKSVLVPRPETELLVERGLEILQGRPGELSILDLGTGSGCVAVALAHELQQRERDFSVLALDTSADALETAADNALRHGLGGDVLFLESNWFSELDPSQDQFDLILSNPPYLAEHEPIVSPELRHEPQEALYAGRHGTEVINQLMEQVPPFLKAGGVFLCEFGAGQRSLLEEHFRRVQEEEPVPYAAIEFHKDLAGLDRVMELRAGDDAATSG